jgi:hypothetical protein
MTEKNNLGTGRIGEIVNWLKINHQVEDVSELAEQTKLDALLTALQLTNQELDTVLAENSPVFRTIKGHAFESVFKFILEENQIESDHIGGDNVIDLKVNGFELQLKTPNMAGTKGFQVQYKTHKTHGAKSEQESMEYYHHIDHFPEFLVGLISYEPLKIIFLNHDEIPRHPKDNNRILSPFTIIWEEHKGLNAFDRISIESIDLASKTHVPNDVTKESLPKTSTLLNLKSEIILDTILNEGNFRIWDMSIRGFAREVAISNFLNTFNISSLNPVPLKVERGDKADFAVKQKTNYLFFQVKGISTNNCKFDGVNSIVATETQLTRGRVNDHPTQSRLYLKTDFEYLILVLDPPQVALYEKEIGRDYHLDWKLFCIPTTDLQEHKVITHRINSLQKFKYLDLLNFELDNKYVKALFQD